MSNANHQNQDRLDPNGNPNANANGDPIQPMKTKPDVKRANACPPLPPNSKLGDRIIYVLGVGLGSGLPRFAAGTWGTLGGLVAGFGLLALSFWAFLVATVLANLVGSYICGRTSVLMGVHDDPHIVWDEWAGIWITLLPLAYWQTRVDFFQTRHLIWWGVAFALFRLFDILKPPPINWADKQVSGGLGIMLDDVIAGVMAGGVWILIYQAWQAWA